mgnify:CR=1 FL=1
MTRVAPAAAQRATACATVGSASSMWAASTKLRPVSCLRQRQGGREVWKVEVAGVGVAGQIIEGARGRTEEKVERGGAEQAAPREEAAGRRGGQVWFTRGKVWARSARRVVLCSRSVSQGVMRRRAARKAAPSRARFPHACTPRPARHAKPALPPRPTSLSSQPSCNTPSRAVASTQASALTGTVWVVCVGGGSLVQHHKLQQRVVALRLAGAVVDHHDCKHLLAAAALVVLHRRADGWRAGGGGAVLPPLPPLRPVGCWRRWCGCGMPWSRVGLAGSGGGRRRCTQRHVSRRAVSKGLRMPG